MGDRLKSAREGQLVAGDSSKHRNLKKAAVFPPDSTEGSELPQVRKAASLKQVFMSRFSNAWCLPLSPLWQRHRVCWDLVSKKIAANPTPHFSPFSLPTAVSPPGSFHPE